MTEFQSASRIWFAASDLVRHHSSMTGVVRGPNDDPNLADDELVAQRTAWFASYIGQINVVAPAKDSFYSCPCCGHRTLTERGAYEICDECGWEDDGQDDHDSELRRGGPNGPLSLDDARANYVARGGVRMPHEVPDGPKG